MFCCPHCSKEIPEELLLAARNKSVAARPRPGARGLVRNPAGKNRPAKTPKRKARSTERNL
jgi:hypothetical protein